MQSQQVRAKNILIGISLLSILLAELAARYKEEGMLAYVNLIQRKEKEIGCDVLTHQKWCVNTNPMIIDVLNGYRSGANYIDNILSTVSSGSSSTSAMGKDSTEHSF
jgi:isocitrate lyase